MTRIILLLAALALSACMPQGGNTRMGLAGTGLIAQAAAQITPRRAQAGVAPVVHSPALQAAAQAHADDLAATGGLSHVSSNGAGLSDRVAATGYTACFAAENVARGQPDVPSVVASWTNSSGHYQNMVNAAAQNFGFARSSDVWVLVLARPC